MEKATGFSDVGDDDVLTLGEIARRMGYAAVSSFRRRLRRDGLPLPRSRLRGRYTGAAVKVWLAVLGNAEAGGGDPQEAAGAGCSPSRRPPLAPNILDFEARRDELRQKMGA